MNKPPVLIITCLVLCIASCMSNSEKHGDFIAHSDCFVYQDEVKAENFKFGRVESIDTSNASECVKMHLSNVYLLYVDSICVAVHNNHPKNNIELIKKFINEFQSDTTRLASFVRSDSSIKIMVDRLCKDSTHDVRYGQFVDWREKEYSTKTSSLTKTRDDLITMWYEWKE